MTANHVITLRRKLEALVEKNHDLLGDEHQNLVRKHGIDRAEDLSNAFAAIDDAERILRIGVVGRVKAGKSSLLNALLFDGDTVLPKAATPMTAALTRLSWGPTLSAEVEFYSDADVENICENARKYKEKREALLRDKLAELRQRRDESRNARNESDESLLDRASRLAKRDLDSYSGLSAAYDQFTRIEQAGLSRGTPGTKQTLDAADLPGLRKQLQEYVSASGRFMPITKAVHIRLPLDNLRDVEIVDTPGLNDPVASREERTCELLKYCDVIFIVSPAGQFFSIDDLDLLGRITHKEGVRELYVLASQVDTQLFGSNHAGGRLDLALKSIFEALGQQMHEALDAFKRNHPEVGNTFDKLIAHASTKLLHTSGIAHGLSSRFEQRASWDDGAAKVWENLSTRFPEYFPEGKREVATANLDKLANIAALHGVIGEVRAQKDVIKAERREVLAIAKRDALVAYCNALLAYADDRRRRIDGADIGKLTERREKLEKRQDELGFALETEFRRELSKFTSELRLALREVVAGAFAPVKKALDADQETLTRTVRTENSGTVSWIARQLSLGGYTTTTYTETTIVTTHVSNGLIAIADEIQAEVDEIIKVRMEQWEDTLRKSLFSAVRANVPDDEVDGYVERRAIRNLVDNLKRPSLETGITLPASLKPRGKLQGTDADAYIEAASNHIYDLERRFSNGIKRYIDDTDALKPTDIAQLFLTGYAKQMAALEREINNKQLVIERLERLVTELRQVMQ